MRFNKTDNRLSGLTNKTFDSIHYFQNDFDKVSFDIARESIVSINSNLKNILNLKDDRELIDYVVLILEWFLNENIEHYSNFKRTLKSSNKNIDQQYADYVSEFYELVPQTLENAVEELASIVSEKVLFKAIAILYLNLEYSFSVRAYQGLNYINAGLSLKRVSQYSWLLNNKIESVFADELLKDSVQADFSFFIEKGSKGGNTKGKIYSPDKEKALAYHDKFFTKKKENGKWLHNNAKTARKIDKHFTDIDDCLKYEVSYLAILIGTHRRNNFK